MKNMLLNHCIGTDFRKKKFAGIINSEEDTPNMRNQHQRHQGNTNSKEDTSNHHQQ